MKEWNWSRNAHATSTAAAAMNSRALPRKIALVYAGESMRVTTRLMQAASWLLIQRAVHEGDMTAEDAASDRYRLGAREICLGKRDDGVEQLPKKLVELLERSDSLYRRVARLDDVLFRQGEARGRREDAIRDAGSGLRSGGSG